MKNTIITLIIAVLFSMASTAQEQAWVYFNGKTNVQQFIDNPTTMLSPKALTRRANQGIALDELDVPIDPTYVQAINTTPDVTVLAKSKWLNAVHVFGTQAAIQGLESLPIVAEVAFADRSLNARRLHTTTSQDLLNKTALQTVYDYGSATNQIEQIAGDYLHEQDFTGQGMTIAVIDNGFPGVDTFAAFQHLQDNNQIKGGYNFVERNDDFYSRGTHGTAVLAAIAAKIEGTIVGTAPDADYYLFITEDTDNEHPLEESLWVEAAEKADSLGVDVLNTSLGYTEFTDSRYNYTYADMNGQTTFISRGADIAFTRGMIVVNAAGNSGSSAWQYIGAPADAENVLSIGAVDASGNIASFSSFGPTSDGRIKPDVCAQGVATASISGSGDLAAYSGTSLAAPVLTGAITCLWQAFPTKTNTEIVEMVKTSAHLYSSPTAQEGYGIPNFENAFTSTLSIDEGVFKGIQMFPNPVREHIVIQNAKGVLFTCYTLQGKLCAKAFVSENFYQLNLANMASGMCIIQLEKEGELTNFKWIKK